MLISVTSTIVSMTWVSNRGTFCQLDLPYAAKLEEYLGLSGQGTGKWGLCRR
jgi:hypothetical protein